jgi:hypothetical protein
MTGGSAIAKPDIRLLSLIERFLWEAFFFGLKDNGHTDLADYTDSRGSGIWFNELCIETGEIRVNPPHPVNPCNCCLCLQAFSHFYMGSTGCCSLLK